MRQSLEKELAAVTSVAAGVGLGWTQPEVLKLAHHTTVRLSPSRAVARVRTSDDCDDSKLVRELSVAKHLASKNAPAVRPASEVPAGPYFENGCAITFWQFVHGRPADTSLDAFAAARALERLHDALADLACELPPFTIAFHSCERILESAGEAPMLQPADRAFLQRLYDQLRHELSGFDLQCRALHGDAHLGNVLITAAGAVWMDLDDVCTGPLEWDVASLAPETWSEFDGIDPELVRLLAALRQLCVSAWCWADFDRSAETREAAINHLDQLKAAFALPPA